MEIHKLQKLTSFLFICLLGLFLVACGGAGNEDDDEDDSSDDVVTVGSCAGNAASEVVVLTVGKGCDQNITGSGNNFYGFSTTAEGTYSISVADPVPNDTNLDWALYTESDYENGEVMTCTDTNSGNQTCTVDLTASSVYFLMVQNQSETATTFTVSVSRL